ncbi:CsbD family protein [Anabaena sp. PCC 7108]|uniref:CsbD family protein n=1 Tax=Anabaena sp. PCC 7108 TaxID=163908 RepID=UPI0005AAF264|nr:CsbD family protein [Anabaena sp. PCC 7108]
MEDVKSNVNLSGRAKAVSKNIEGKTQAAAGNITGDLKDQVVGKAKQAESQVRNTVEDVKAKVQDIFN